MLLCASHLEIKTERDAAKGQQCTYRGLAANAFMYVQKKSQCMCEAVLVLTIDSCSTACFSHMHWPLSSPDRVRAMGSGYVLPLADGVSVNVCKSANPAFPVIPFKITQIEANENIKC